MTATTWPSVQLRRFTENWDYLRVPLNADERHDRPGTVPYWGANSIQGYVDEALVSCEVVLVGEDGAPFFDRDRPVAFRIDEPIWPNNHIHVLKPDANTDARWLAYALNCVDYSQYILGSTRDKLNQSALMQIMLVYPPRDQQVAIADFLDRETARIDTLIDEQERLIELLRERRSAVIADATGWGQTQRASWPLKRLSWIFDETGSGTTPANEDITYSDDAEVPWVTTGELREQRISKTARGVSWTTVERYPALKIFPAGSLLIAMYGATIGRLGILDVPAASNQACCALIGPRETSAEFALYSLLAARDRMLLDAAGGGQPNINQEKIRVFRIPVPSCDEQRRIVTYLDQQTAQIDATVVEAKRCIELSRERRVALITAAVTGQIDVRDPEPVEIG